MMSLENRLAIQAKNLTRLFYRIRGNHPERGTIVYRSIDETHPDLWESLVVTDAFQSSGLKIEVQDKEKNIFTLALGEWIDMELAQKLWATVIPFVIESSRGRSLYVVEGGNTMVYIPKCKQVIETGLPDASVMRAISGETSIRYTKCPYDATNGKECRYPECIRNMVATPQPSIKASKAAFRDAVCVCLTRNIRDNKMLFLTNGANHLNLITVEQALESAWHPDWLKNLEPVVLGALNDGWDSFGYEDWNAQEAYQVNLAELYDLKNRRAEELDDFPEIDFEELDKDPTKKVLSKPMAEQSIEELAKTLPDNIVVKRGKKDETKTEE